MPLRVFSLATFITDFYLRQAIFVAPASICSWQYLRSLLRKRLPHETSGTKKFFRGLLISVIALTVLGGFWFLSQLGPKDVDYRDFNYNMEVLDSIKAIQQESIELEEQFEEVLVLREPRPEDMNLLKKALDKQKEYLAAIRWGRLRGL